MCSVSTWAVRTRLAINPVCRLCLVQVGIPVQETSLSCLSSQDVREFSRVEACVSQQVTTDISDSDPRPNTTHKPRQTGRPFLSPSNPACVLSMGRGTAWAGAQADAWCNIGVQKLNATASTELLQQHQDCSKMSILCRDSGSGPLKTVCEARWDQGFG